MDTAMQQKSSLLHGDTEQQFDGRANKSSSYLASKATRGVADKRDEYDGPAPDGRHGRRLLVQLVLLFLAGCVAPLVLRFVLVYVGHYSIKVAVAACSACFGLFALLGWSMRTYSLARRNSTTRPVGASRWSFDYFHLNFTFGIVFVTVVLSAANAMKPPQFEAAALPLTLLLVQVCGQLVVVQIVSHCKIGYHCRISSMPRGTGPMRSALFTIIEDLVAVEGKQGTVWRAAFNERYERSPDLRLLLDRLSWMWGLGGCIVAAIDFALIFKLRNVADGDVSWAIGHAVPWIFIAVMTIPTVVMVKKVHD